MKPQLLFFTLFVSTALSAARVQAQLVNDGATNILSNVTNSPSNLTVGTNGSFTLLVLSNNASLLNTATGVIGRNASAQSNEVRITGASANWTMGSFASLYVGSNGAANRLTISGGGTMQGFFFGNLGQGSSSTNNSVFVADPGSLWSGFTLFMGGGGRNQLTVSNGATVWTSGGNVGLGSASNNLVTVTGAGSLWTNDIALVFGSSGNRAMVSDGGGLANINSTVGLDVTAHHNTVWLTDNGSSWTNSGYLRVGDGGVGNQVIASNGATVYVGGNAVIGTSSTARSNAVTVTGQATTWIGNSNLYVGSNAPFSRLVISDGAIMFAREVLYVGFGPTSASNLVAINDGSLVITNATGGGLFEIRRGTNILNGGLIEADILRMTNGPLGRFQFNAGTLAVKSSRISIANPLIVGDGTTPATFRLAGNGTHDFSGTLGLIITNNATLTGNGSLVAQLQVRAGATLAPGASVGRISLSTPPFLSGATVMEISKSGPILTNDQVQVTGTLTYGGTLTVTDLGPTPLVGGDRFKLFDASAYAGAFTGITLPPLPPGLIWINNLMLDGSIEIFAPPVEGAGFALGFDGTDDFVRISHDSRLNAYPLVVTAWIKTTQTTGEVGLINKFVAGSFNGWHLGLLNGEVRAWYARDNANRIGSPGTGISGGPVGDGEWHHVAFTVDATGGSLFVDGFFKQKLAWVGTPGACTTTQELALGRYPGGAGEFFQGRLDEVALWGFSEPTPAEIKANLNRGLIGSEIGLITYHRLNEGADIVAENGANPTGTLTRGILQNGVSWVPGLMLRPAVLTKLATTVTMDSAKLNGVGNPSLTDTTTWFEWGTTTNYGNSTPAHSLGSGGNNTQFSQSITGLTENVTYHFRAVASNVVGASFGADKSFVATGTNLLNPRVDHTATLLPNGKVLVVGGRGQGYTPLSSAELYDPASRTWTFTTPMSTVRHSHSATVLPNGKVLVAGGLGQDFTPAHASAELYDPVTGTWTSTGAMATNRFAHTATLLFNGMVLVAGGLSDSGFNTIAELYDPATGNWAPSGAMEVGRYVHTTTLLPNGKVLVAGGRDGNAATISNTEIYDPATATWTNSSSMTTNRYSHTATLLRNGKVLVVGGRGLANFLNSAELYDPVADTWSATGAMLNYRFGHTATLLPDGRVFASGDGIGVPSVYNPLTGTWTDVPGPDPNSGATATLLPNGNVLVAGGSGNFFTDGDPTAEAALYLTPNNGSWSLTAPMANARDGHTASLLPDGRVLVASFTNSELYHPITGTWSNTGALNSGRNGHTATLLPNGKVLAVGGINFSTVTGAELYELATGMWTSTGSLATNRIGGHTATLLFNGKVLVTGGNGELFGPPLRNAELYDPAAGIWTDVASLTTNRSGHSATLLPNGKVLVTGGLVTGGFFPSATSTAELFDLSTGLWTALPPMATNRSAHIAVLLPDGRVLVAGGSPASLSAANADAELFDPVTGAWKKTGSMTTGRQGATATLLSNGKVLVAGGYNLAYLASAELYDPATGKWTATAPLGAAHTSHTSTLLPNGRVLVAGGFFGSSNTNRAELYDIGLGFSDSWRPQITGISSPVNLGGSLILTGAQFRGLSEGSGGNSSQNSQTDYPLVQLRSVESQQTRFVPSAEWSTNSLSSTPVTGLSPGWTMATVFVNGIPSQSSLVSLLKPTAIVILSNLFQDFDGTAKSVSVSTVPPGLMVAVTYNGSPNAPTNIGSYTVVGTIIDQDYDSTPVTNTLVIAPARDFGVDVSHWQNESGIPQSSWDQMYADGKRFVFIKATEGLTGPHDPTMAVNVQRASAAGLLVGVYHYAHPENRPTTNGAILEASNMVVYAGSAIGPGRLRPVLDLEGSAANLSTTALTDWVIAFGNEIIARRGPSAAPIIYCNQTFANNELDSRLASYDLWLRTVGTGANPAVNDPPGVGFADATGVFDNWSFWQYSATGSSGGISPLDLNVCHSEFKPLASFIITNVMPTPITVANLNITPGGVFSLSFTNAPGAVFSVLATTNLALPSAAWEVLGIVTETSAGQFQFSDPQTTNHPQRYYRVRSP